MRPRAGLVGRRGDGGQRWRKLRWRRAAQKAARRDVEEHGDPLRVLLLLVLVAGGLARATARAFTGVSGRATSVAQAPPPPAPARLALRLPLLLLVLPRVAVLRRAGRVSGPQGAPAAKW